MKYFSRPNVPLRAIAIFWLVLLADEFTRASEHPAEVRATPNEECYLARDSAFFQGYMGKYLPFPNRFKRAGRDMVYDQMLYKTWIVPRDPRNPAYALRLNWEKAEALANRLNASLPTIKELKTLVTLKKDEHYDVFEMGEYFPPSARTAKCWAADNFALWLRPYQRHYVDFAAPDCGITSMSEVNMVLLIK